MKNLKYFATLITTLFIFTQTTIAQRYTNDLEYKAGDIEIQTGIGLLSTFVSSSTSTKIPPISLILNYRVKKAFSLGAYLGYSSTVYDPKFTKGDELKEGHFLKNDFYLTGLRAQGHYNSGRIDFYGGAMLGYNFSRVSTNITNPLDRPEGIMIKPKSNLMTWSGYIGFKYTASTHLGFYGEIGYGASLVNLGLSFRL